MTPFDRLSHRVRGQHATLCLYVLACTFLYASPCHAAEHAFEPKAIELLTYEAIHIGALDHGVDHQMAQILRDEFAALYGVRLQIHAGPLVSHRRVIFVGRTIATQLGLFSTAEFESVKWDGYLIKAGPRRIIISGYAPQGTIYGTYTFLRKTGLTFYPWHFGKGLKRYDPIVNGVLPAFSIVDKPFFELRDVLGHRGKGRFGSTIRAYALGELKWARQQPALQAGGYIGWDHTAGYLAPIKAYLASHPEFYATQKGKTIPLSTPTMRVGLCMCHKSLEAITVRNALTWMDRQPARRFFAVTDGDQSGGRCPSCAGTDPIPDYYTDRNLRWVNAVARAIRDRHPDNRVFTLAYLDTVKPPIETRLEPNAFVLYAPWYWRSRTTSAVGFDHPLNVVAMEELMAWKRLFPGQIGVYDYPGSWVYGAAERIRFYAKHNLRWVYMNGPRGDLLHWVASQLLWDPQRDVDDLVAAFVTAFYGPSAEPMQAYYALRRDTIRQRALTSFSSLALLQDDDFIKRARLLLLQAIARAKGADVLTRIRVQESVTEQLFTMIRVALAMQTDIEILLGDFKWYLQGHQALWAYCDRTGCSDRQWRMRTQMFTKQLKRLGLPQVVLASTSQADRQHALERALSHFTDEVQIRVSDKRISPPPAGTTHAFTGPGERQAWQVWRVNERLDGLVQPRTRVAPHGETLSGAGATLALSQLPLATRGRLRVNVGQFRLRRRFQPALDGRGQRYVSLHVHASHAVPVTVYINEKPALRSDIHLSPGEQIVRIDLHNFARRGHEVHDVPRIEFLTLDVWPQNLLYPYPETHDTELLFLGLSLDHRPPTPQSLPYKGDVIWMSHFRPNIPHAKVGIGHTATGLRYLPRSRKERFRSSTAHRALIPISAIVIAPSDHSLHADAVSRLRRRLKMAYGVELPVRRRFRGQTQRLMGNAIFLGPMAALAHDRMQLKALDNVGRDGFVIRARNGAISIAGNDWEATWNGVSTYLRHQGLNPQSQSTPLIQRSLFLHELYLTETLP